MNDLPSVLYYTGGAITVSGNISEANIGRAIILDGSSTGLNGGGVTTFSGTNTFTGGVQVSHSQLNLNAAQAQGTLGSVASATNNGEIVLGFAPTIGHRFS